MTPTRTIRRRTNRCSPYARPRRGRVVVRGTGSATACAPTLSAIRRALSTQPDPRVEEAIDQVDSKTGEHDCKADQEHDRLDDGVVTTEDRFDEEPSGAWNGKDRLGDDRPAEEVAQLNAQDGDDRQHPVLERVPQDDAAL